MVRVVLAEVSSNRSTSVCGSRRRYRCQCKMVETCLVATFLPICFLELQEFFFTIEGFSEELAAHIVSFAVRDSEFVPCIELHHKHSANGDPIPVIHVVWVFRLVLDDTVYLECAQRKRFHLQGQ